MRKYTIYKSVQGKERINNLYEDYLQEFDISLERTYVKTSFGRTHVLINGPKNAPPLFILQGGNCINPMTLSWFKPLLKNYRVYAPDTLGHPGYSEETRVSGQDDSYARWLNEIMNHFQIKKAAFLGASFGAGIILRMAVYMPAKVSCAILVSPAGIALGSKWEMIKKILIPLLKLRVTGSTKHLTNIAHHMSLGSMKEIDTTIIGDIFTYVKLEQAMPKLTERAELQNFTAPTMVISGKSDLFFPESRVSPQAKLIISNLTSLKAYEMAHFPSQIVLDEINKDILSFLMEHYQSKGDIHV